MADFNRLRWIFQIEDDRDIADEAFLGRGNVGIAPIEIVAMYATAAGFPFSDLPGRRGVLDVIDREAADEILAFLFADHLMVDDHDAVGDAHLVGVPAVRHLDFRERLRLSRIGNIENGGAARRLHVCDVHCRAVDPDLAAAGTINVGNMLGVFGRRHERSRETASFRCAGLP